MQLLQEYFTDLLSPEWAWHLIGINLLIVTGYLFIFKFKLAWFADVSLKEELAEKDNPAFGFVLASLFFSFFLVMSAASTGNDIIPIKHEIFLMLGYGFAGMLMLLLSKLLFDKFIFKAFCLQEEIRNRNMAAAIVEGTNAISTALIVFTYMGWVKGTSFDVLLLVAYGWVMSQILLSIFTFIRVKLYKKCDRNISLIDAIKEGNVAVAIRYSAYKISFAMTPMVAAPHYKYNVDDAWWYANAIFLSSIILSVLICVISSIMKKIIMPNIDFHDEINKQNNTGLAYVESSLVVGMTIAAFCFLK